jgi:hypothetical protein
MARRAPKPPSAAPRQPTLRDEIAASGETPVDAAAAAERADREDHGFLSREFLSWLCWHADVEGGAFEGEGEVPDFTVAIGARVTMRSAMGSVTDVALKGAGTGTSADLRYALAGGQSVREVELRLEQDERAWSFGLGAELFDLKRVKLPELLTEEDDEPADERIALLAALDAALRLAFARFLALRTRPAWTRTTVPALRSWLEEGT